MDTYELYRLGELIPLVAEKVKKETGQVDEKTQYKVKT